MLRKRSGEIVLKIRAKLQSKIKKTITYASLVVWSFIFSIYLTYIVVNIFCETIPLITFLGSILFSVYILGITYLFKTVRELVRYATAVILASLFYGLAVIGIALLLVEPTEEQELEAFLKLLEESRWIITMSISGVIIPFITLLWRSFRGASDPFLFLAFIASLALLYLHSVVLYGVIPTKIKLEDLYYVNKSSTDINKINAKIELAKEMYQMFKDTMEIIGLMLTISVAIVTYIFTKKA